MSNKTFFFPGNKSNRLHPSILKVPQARLQQHMNQELPDVQLGYRKGRGTADQIANIYWIIDHKKKTGEIQKNIYLCFIDYTKAFGWVEQNKLWKILQEMGIPGHLTCLLRNLYAGQEAAVRNRLGKTNWFNIGKELHQGCILSTWLFDVTAEYIMWNAGLGKAQLGIKVARKNINNHR